MARPRHPPRFLPDLSSLILQICYLSSSLTPPPFFLRLMALCFFSSCFLNPASPPPAFNSVAVLSFPISTHIPPKIQPSRSNKLQTGCASDPGGARLGILDGDLLRRVSAAKDADEVIELIEEGKSSSSGGVLSVDDCCVIIEAAFARGNADLALSVYSAMRSMIGREKIENGRSVEKWRLDQPDLRIHSLLIQRLAECLRVSDANKMIGYISRVGVSPGEEVSFGKIIRCPACKIAIVVAQPQHGIQAASCSKCRYQYELVSGEIVNIESEELSLDISAWEKGLRLLQITKDNVPAAIHSIVVRTPTGTARTHRFSTKTVDLPAQEGERVTIALATTSDVSREIGPIRFNARSPQFNPGQPLCLTNHINGQESQLLRPPKKDANSFLFIRSLMFPALAVLASGNVASEFVDLSIPRLVAVTAVSLVALGTAANHFVVPQLNRLPEKIVDLVAIKQQLLSQHDMLQLRIRDLIQASEKEVWMLARMYRLEKKILAVGEPSYRARRNRIRKVCESLESSLVSRIELLETFARISSMIEIEVEMDSDVLAAEAESNAERISEQIEQIMEIENLEETWKIQAEANDEVERLLSSQLL